MLFRLKALSYPISKVAWWQSSLILIYVLLNIINQLVLAAPHPISEYELKAVYLNNFAKFIVWPANSLNNKNTPFYICILGKDPFEFKLDITIENEEVDGHPISVNRLQKLENSEHCHILYVSQSEKANVTDILQQIHSRPILTVSDIEDFIQLGGMIEYYLQDNRVRFKINPVHIRNIGLSPSSSLLEIATIVTSAQ